MPATPVASSAVEGVEVTGVNGIKHNLPHARFDNFRKICDNVLVKLTVMPKEMNNLSNAPANPASTITPEKPAPKRKKRRAIITTLSVVVAVVGLFFIIYPFWPGIQYELFPPNIEKKDYLVANSDTATSAADGSRLPIARTKVPLGNKIMIPKIGVEMPIVEGTNEKIALNQGAWRMPQTSTPDQDGNTVITGHRFKYIPPSKETFYLLDKLAVGDEFVVNWEGLEYNYKVTETKVVEPTALEVLDNTATPRVTIITCTPLFTTKQRLIVIGEPI